VRPVPTYAIEVEGLGKRFRIQQAAHRTNTLRDAVAQSLRGGLSRVRSVIDPASRANPEADDFWALRDLDFSIPRGEAVGIIGPNGAGKSTLLKILSRITEPTEGIARIRGRIGSLLEVGTGFHSELTGRENTYMSGAILGMRRAEIDRKFDEIVAFAGIDRFIDTPAKHYSSGMYLRLAFAVAAHLEPDILVVDEVLAVGDAEFQKKCLGKMEEVSRREGRTVCFVSHNLAAVQRLCDRSLLLRGGRMIASGSPAEVARTYLAGGTSDSVPRTWIPVGSVVRRGSGACRVDAVWFSGGDPGSSFAPYSDGPLEVRLAITADIGTPVRSLAVMLFDAHGTKLVNADTTVQDEPIVLEQGENRVNVVIESLHLNPGRYTLGLWITDDVGNLLQSSESVIDMEVVDPPGPARRRPDWDGSVTCGFRAWMA